MKKRVYIAGRMRGLPLFNFPAFDAARDRLEALGIEVLSPADMDRAAGFDPEVWASSFDLTLGDGPDWDKIPRGFDLVAAVNRDNAAIESADAVFVLREGADKSENTPLEVMLAVRLGKRILTDAMSDREVVAALGGSWELVPGPYRWEVPPESNGWADVMRGEVEMCTCFAYDAAERAAKIADALNAQAAGALNAAAVINGKEAKGE